MPALRRAVAGSFERITVDGQMSTNDTVVLQATGTAGAPIPEGLLEAVLLQLALDIVADGEGASRVGRIEVTGARDDDEAEIVARAIANSPLVKTAMYGRDPTGGASPRQPEWRWPATNCPSSGRSTSTPSRSAAEPEAEIGLRLERGEGAAHVYFSDLTPDYVRLNSEYTT